VHAQTVGRREVTQSSHGYMLLRASVNGLVVVGPSAATRAH